MTGRFPDKKVLEERADIVCRMKLEGWTHPQIAGYIGMPAHRISGIVKRLKREGRLPNRRMWGTRNPVITLS